MSTTQCVRTFCRHCVALCGLEVEVTEGEVTRVRGDADHPVSHGYSCPKGRSLGADHRDPDRWDHPGFEGPGGPEGPSWDEVLDDLAERVANIGAVQGPDAVGLFLGTGGAFDAAGTRVARRLLQRMGSASVYSSATIDAPAKPYVAGLVAGDPALFSPVVDLEEVTLTLLVGTNPVISHGHTTGMPNPRGVLRHLRSRGEVWVIDPRRTETADLADHHLAPVPGTDHVWLAAVVRELLGSVDRDALERRAEGVRALERAVAGYTLARAAATCGLALADLEQLVATITRHGRVAFQSGTGVTMTAAGTATEWLLWALAAITDSLDAPGGVWFNPGFLRAAEERDGRPVVTDGAPGPASRPELRARYGERPSVAIVDEIEAGNLRGLLLFGGSLLTALPDVERTRRALGSLEVLAVLDVRGTETTALATHTLPTLAQLERADVPYATDTYTPAVATQYTDAVLPAIARRRPAWWILASLAQRLGHDVLGGGLTAESATVDDVFAPLVRRRGVDLATLRSADGAVATGERPIGWVRERILRDGRWQVAPPDLVAALEEAESVAAVGELRLVPRRQLRHLNSQLTIRGTRDGRMDLPLVQLHPERARRHGLADGDGVRLRSPHGTLDGIVEVDASLHPDAVSVPHGYEGTNVNRLTDGADDVDVRTGMPRFSGTAVELVPVDPPSPPPTLEECHDADAR